MNRLDNMANLSLEAIENIVKKNTVKPNKLVYSDNSFLIQKTRELVFNRGHGYIPPLNVFRSSRLPHKCVRLQQLEKIAPDTGKPHTFKQQGVFAVGNGLHEYDQNYLQKSRSLILASELKVSHTFKDIVMTGHVDLLVLDPEHGVIVTDIKTMSGKAFHWLDDYGISNEYQLQANIYSSIVKSKEYSIKCISKENFDMREYFFKQNNNLFQAMEEKAQLIYVAIRTKFLLPRLQEFPDYWTCQYEEKDYRGNPTGNTIKCQFFDICEKVESYEELIELEVE